MLNKSKFNLIVSSWPSAGGTTMALSLASLLELQYTYAGGVWKEWGRRMGYDPTTNNFHEFEQRYGVIWDLFWEQYIKAKLLSGQGLLCEGKLTGFLAKTSDCFALMVTADAQIRASRANKDFRTEDVLARDQILSDRWQNLFSVNIFSKEQISQHYDLTIDNSQLSIAESLELATKSINKWLLIKDLPQLNEIIAESLSELEFNAKDKPKLISDLTARGLYATNDNIFTDWRENYSPELAKLPKEMLAVL